MEKLEHPDCFHLSAAQGWLELGNASEAGAELALIRPGLCEHPAVLEVRWQLAAKLERWEEGLRLAELLCAQAPEAALPWIHRSFCLHELKRTQEAWDKLLPKAELFPNEWLIRYNLACYACQLGHLTAARTWLSAALKVGDACQIKALARADPDLKALLESKF
jgi:hypothetical protein